MPYWISTFKYSVCIIISGLGRSGLAKRWGSYVSQFVGCQSPIFYLRFIFVVKSNYDVLEQIATIGLIAAMVAAPVYIIVKYPARKYIKG